MRKIEVYENESTDRNIFFIYECEDKSETRKELVGVNFHHGAGDLDMSYATNDEELLKLYLEEAKALRPGMVYNKIKLAEAAIDRWMIAKNDWMRAAVIKEEIENSIDALFAVCHERCNTKSGDISPSQVAILEIIKNNLQALIEEQITQNIDHGTDSSN